MRKFLDLFKTNTTKKDTEINIQSEPGHYALKLKVRTTTLPKKLGKGLVKSTKSGHLEKVKHVNEVCMVSPVVITVKNKNSVKISKDTKKTT